MKFSKYIFVAVAVLGLLSAPAVLRATPYASGISVSGTTVTFTLNETADSLMYSINGGASVPFANFLKGSHTFQLTSPTDTFSIVAEKSENGFTVPDGNTLAASTLNMSQTVPRAYSVRISDDSNSFNRYNSLRGLAVGTDPNGKDSNGVSNFGTTYISNSAAGSTTGIVRALGDGLYALKADQTDSVYAYGNTAKQSAVLGATATSNTPYRLTAGKGGDIYVTGYGDAVSSVWKVSPDLGTITNVLKDTNGSTVLPAGQNHGSSQAVAVVGSNATSDLQIWTIDEDLTTNFVTGSGSTTDTNSIWRYNINANPIPYNTMPTKFAGVLLPSSGLFDTDLERGPDGKFYALQNNAAGSAAGLYVLDSAGAVVWDSLNASRTALGDFTRDGTVDARDYVLWSKTKGTSSLTGLAPADGNGDGTVDALDLTTWRSHFGTSGIVDFYRQSWAVTISPDGTYMAVLHNGSEISITPLVNGVPDIGRVMGVNENQASSGARDIAFDAAGNLHYVNATTQLYRVLAPGGHTLATTSWNGTSYAFNVTTLDPASALGLATVPEPSTLLNIVAGLSLWSVALRGRKRRDCVKE